MTGQTKQAKDKNNDDWQKLAPYRRIVIKIGSSLLVDNEKGLNSKWLGALTGDIAALRQAGHEVLVVSSGAIALGRGVLGLSGKSLKLAESQAAAAAGQIALARAYGEALAPHGLEAAQILLTLGDTEQRRRYLNARATIETLLDLGAVPIINENDTVATTEIRFGDNDRLAARVATMTASNLLVLLSDIDGLYTAPPGNDPKAELVREIVAITPEIEAMAGEAGTAFSRGGMVTKIEAAKIAIAGGTDLVITSGKKRSPIAALARGERASWFKASQNPVTARKKWIAGQLDLSGRLILDQGALTALYRGNSLLAAGVKKIEGNFTRGDIVAIADEAGKIIGKGIIAYDSNEAGLIIGCKSTEIARLLGYEGRGAMIHRDDMHLVQADQTIMSGMV